MLKPGDKFIYTDDNKEYLATVIMHDLVKQTFMISVLGQGGCISVPDSIEVAKEKLVK